MQLTSADSREPSQSTRAAEIANLSRRVAALQTLGMTERAAIRQVARELDLPALYVKRLVVLYPEA